MENKDHTPDLQRMRDKLELLERRIKNENIVNEKLMRHIMRDKAAGIGNRVRALMAVIVLAIPYTAWAFHHIGFSTLFMEVTCLFLLAAVAYGLYTYRLLRAADFTTGDLMDASRRMLRMKRLRARWLRFSIPFCLAWLAWMGTEAYRITGGNLEYLAGFYAGAGCGGVIGGCIGFMHYRKTQRTISEILDNIREVTGTAS